MIKFYKYQGAGNDFIIIDDRERTFNTNQDFVKLLCDRRFGIGADGLMLLQNEIGYDFKMVYFNSDGSEGSMCGNGGRCLVRFAHDMGFINDETSFIATDGHHLATVYKDNISLKMIDVSEITSTDDSFFLNTGSPHYVKFVSDLANLNIVEEGKKIRYGSPYVEKGGTNVNFVEVLHNNSLFVRTYERGVEDETLACGTGVTACAIASKIAFGFDKKVTIKAMGGYMAIEFDEVSPKKFENIYLIGPAEKVFEGVYNA
ncbi:MAG: diaminopimelate epimerase [Pseudarcicella sp.]|nr:diaminopimelate epimerase [Pseudarcicella sp.]MBP6410556.1 diaminopimelate epimerase [Pseudarcicella sp.]